MQSRWLNDKQADENGDFILVIENGKGGRVSTFKGKTVEEVAEKAAGAQIQATEEINRLRKPDTAKPRLKVEQRTITPSDRLRLSEQMTDPSSVVEAVEEIVTARQGIAPDQVGNHLSRMSAEDSDKYYADEAQAFRDEHPDFYPVPQNRDALFEELRANGWDLTRNNLAIAYRTLVDRGDMIPWPSDENEREPNQPHLVEPTVRTNGQPTATAPSPRPRSIATGIRNADASASAPTPVSRKAKYTRSDIERMSRAEFADKLRNEPGFRQQVDSMGT